MATSFDGSMSILFPTPPRRILAFQLDGKIKSEQTVIGKVDIGDTLRNP